MPRPKSYRNDRLPPGLRQPASGESSRKSAGNFPGFFAATGWLWVVLLCVFPVGAQPPTLYSPPTAGEASEAAERNRSPGEQPNAGDSDRDREEREIDPRAFLVLDKAGNPVVIPGMTFEKLDALLRLQEGGRRPAQFFTIESVEVKGRVEGTSAELNVTVRVDVEPTEGQWITVPLRMGNFHRTGPADISGVEDYRMDLDDDGGHLLRLRSDSRRSVVVSMRVLCRVSPPPGSAIEFRLPEAPSRVVLEVPGEGVSVSVVGRGDEVRRTRSERNMTEVTVDGGGGSFSLRFGTQLPVVETRPSLESESRIVVDWQQADNAPIVTYDVAVRSRRGDLPRFSLAVPGEVPLQQPTIRGGAPFEVIDPLESELTAEGPPVGEEARDGLHLFEVVPSGTRGDSRAEIGLVTQLQSEGGRPGGTVVIRGVAVSDAVEQTGEIEVRTPRDFRLRWNSQPWVSSLWDQGDSDSLGTRIYRFRFDRVPFELPVWLSARAKQLRVEGDYRVTFYDTSVSLRLILKTGGGVPDSRILPLSVGPWRVQNLTVAETAAAIEADQDGDILEIDLASLPAGGENDRIEITLVHPLEEDQDRVELGLPRIVGDREAIAAASSVLSVATQSEYRFIADLGSSMGVGEVLRSSGNGTPTASAAPPAADGSAIETRYLLPDVGAEGKLVGFLVADRPQISYQAEAEISLAGNRLLEVLDWTVYPQSALRGRLGIAWGPTEEAESSGNASAAAEDGEASEPSPVHRMPAVPLWNVSVDDSPAILRADSEGRYAIYSEKLSGGPHRIRLRRSRDLPTVLGAGSPPAGNHLLAGVYLPRPAIGDAVLRGAANVRLRGAEGIELAARDSQGRWIDEVSLTAISADELPLRLRVADRRQEDVRVRRAVLRSVIVRNAQHDHLIGTVEGGGLLRLPLQGVDEGALVRGSVNDAPAEVFRDEEGHAVLRLGEKGTHTIAVQIWQARETPLLSDTISPWIQLPLGTERFFWEIITPQDDHLVWVTPTVGQAMRWHFDRWRLFRRPVQSDTDLASWAGGSWETRIPPGNRYLFVGVDGASLSAAVMSRLMIWLIVGATVLIVSCMLLYFPATRHPLVAILGAVLLGGLTLLLPDASVLAGQVMLVAMLIVAVMAGVGYLLAPRRSSRVMTAPTERLEPSSVRPGSHSRRVGSEVKSVPPPHLAASGSPASGSHAAGSVVEAKS